MAENCGCCATSNISIKGSPSIHRRSILHTITSRSISNISNFQKLDEPTAMPSSQCHSFKVHKIPIYHESAENLWNKPPPSPAASSSSHHYHRESFHSHTDKDFFRSQLYPKSSFRSTTTLKCCSTGGDVGGVEIPIKFLRFEDSPKPSKSQQGGVKIQNNIRVSSSSSLSSSFLPSSRLSKSTPDLELNVEIKMPHKDIKITRKFQNPVRIWIILFSWFP
jgi:hypothetical protein